MGQFNIKPTREEFKQGYINQLNHKGHPDNKHRSKAFRHIIPLRPLFRHEIAYAFKTTQ